MQGKCTLPELYEKVWEQEQNHQAEDRRHGASEGASGAAQEALPALVGHVALLPVRRAPFLDDLDGELLQGARSVRGFRGNGSQCRGERRQLLRIEGIDRQRIITEAGQERRERARDGWGASACRQIVAEVTR